jgi:hypothetical protein
MISGFEWYHVGRSGHIDAGDSVTSGLTSMYEIMNTWSNSASGNLSGSLVVSMSNAHTFTSP